MRPTREDCIRRLHRLAEDFRSVCNDEDVAGTYGPGLHPTGDASRLLHDLAMALEHGAGWETADSAARFDRTWRFIADRRQEETGIEWWTDLKPKEGDT